MPTNKLPPAPPSEATPLVNNATDEKAIDDEEKCLPPANNNTVGTSPSWKEAFAHVAPYLKPSDGRHRVIALVALLAVFLEKIVNVLPPLAIRHAVDAISDFSSSAGDEDVQQQQRVAISISLAIGAYFLLQTIDSLLSAVQNVAQRAVSLDAERRFASALFAHLNLLGASYHLERHSGELLRILSRGSDATSTIIESLMFSLLPTLFEAVVVGGVFWLLGMPSIAISTILSVICYIVYTYYVTNTRMQQRRKVLEKSEDVGRIETETLVNYETVAIFGKEKREVEEYDFVRKDYTNERVNMLGLFSWLQLGQQTIRLSGICIGLWLAGRAAVYGIGGDVTARLSPGSFVIVQLYIQRLFNPLSVLGFIYRQITDAFTDLEKAVQMLQTQPIVKDATNAVEWDEALLQRNDKQTDDNSATGDIEFRNVTFRYKVRSARKKLGGSDVDKGHGPEKGRGGGRRFGRRGLWGGRGKAVYNGTGGRGAGQWIKAAGEKNASDDKAEGSKREEIGGIKNVSFHIPAGKTVALVGPSGGGKTTIVRLLLRLYDADDGDVLVDGINVKSLYQQSLRSNIGVVAQDTVLFHASLRENICYGKEDATEEEIWEAVRLAALEDLVNSLPEKLDTIVGERGMKLSGGERQRVGLARCIIKEPKLILLDEATSSLDSSTEKKIQRNILTPQTSAICKGRTTLMIAHRLSTAMQSDIIIVLDKGTVVEQGTHEELLALGDEGMYAKMWKDQMAGLSLDELK